MDPGNPVCGCQVFCLHKFQLHMTAFSPGSCVNAAVAFHQGVDVCVHHVMGNPAQSKGHSGIVHGGIPTIESIFFRYYFKHFDDELTGFTVFVQECAGFVHVVHAGGGFDFINDPRWAVYESYEM